ncbi:MAG: hypothetical protein DWH91_03790 [Planctomycetota bacterium]|nr:MAG: hypothetical protein DWH91_03790 [Planctomycetota bacterium]
MGTHMGIDLIDITFRVEKVFSLKLKSSFWDDLIVELRQTFPDSIVTDITVGQLHRGIVNHLKAAQRLEESTFLAQANRDQVLATLRTRYAPRGVTAETQLSQLHDRPLFREDWYDLGDLFQVPLPDVGWSRWSITVIGLGLVASLVVFVVSQWWNYPWGYVAIIDTGVLTALIAWRMNRESKRFPPQIQTVRHLTDYVLFQRMLQSPEGRWTDDVAWVALQQILTDALGVDAHEVTPEARIIHDLGAD